MPRCEPFRSYNAAGALIPTTHQVHAGLASGEIAAGVAPQPQPERIIV